MPTAIRRFFIEPVSEVDVAETISHSILGKAVKDNYMLESEILQNGELKTTLDDGTVFYITVKHEQIRQEHNI